MILLDSNFGLFFGRFHPLVVHLPIGFLLLGAIFHYLGRREKYGYLQKAVAPTILLGTLSAALSVVLGLALASEGGYDDQALFWHKWLGIAVLLLSVVAWMTYTDRLKAMTNLKSILMGFVVLLLIMTGHLGGSLTHGEGYLLQHAPGFVQSIFGKSNDGANQLSAADIEVDSLLVYAHVIEPVLEKKCWSCHNDQKQSGNLQMNTVETLLEGGDHGEVLLAGNAMESELFHRVTLDPDSEKFMPPKGDALTFDEIKILEWWLNSGMSFDTYLSDLAVPEDIKVILLRSFGVDAVKKPYVEKIEVEPVLDTVTAELEALGFRLTPLAENNHLLEVSIKDSLTLPMVKALQQAHEQVTWLNFGASGVTDQMLTELAKLPNLTRLRLEKNAVTDEGVAHLAGLEHLESLNLYGTSVTDNCLETIQDMPGLKRVFLWQTEVTQQAVDALLSNRKDLEVDLGFQFVKLETEK